MKKILLLLTIISSFIGVTQNVSAFSQCDQSFNGWMLRYDRGYEFYDTWNNGEGRNVYLNHFYVDYENPNYLDSGSPFHWTDQIRSSGFKVSPYSNMEIVNTSPTNWRIANHPTTRTNGTIANHDFGIRYKVDYDYSNNYPDASDDISHTECVYYSVSWCWDGVVDSWYETCDPNDSTHAGWWDGWCHPTTCTPIVGAPTCKGVTVNPSQGTRPVDSTVTCTGYKANSFKIDCGNGQVFTGNGTGNGTESLTKVCHYQTAGSYNVTCTINDTISNDSCRSNVTVQDTNPTIAIDKRDANPNDKDGVVGNDTQTVDSGTSAVFKIRVTNTWTEPLKSINLTDPVEPSCWGSITLPNTHPSTWKSYFLSWNDNNQLDPGEYFEYTCEKANTTAAYTNTANVTWVGVYSNTTVWASDPTEVRLSTPYYDLALVKKVKNPATSYKKGDTVTFEISVINQGTINANDVEVSDYIPAGLTLIPDSVWTMVGSWSITTSSGGTYSLAKTGNIWPITAWSTKNINISFKIDTISWKLINWSEISKDDGNDVDSTPDDNPKNDCHGGKIWPDIDPNSDNRTDGIGDANHNGVCEPGEDEDDADPAEIDVGTVPAIAIDKRDANLNDLDKNIGNDTQTVNSWDKAVFIIRVTNVWPEALKNIKLTDAIAPNCWWDVNLPSTYPSTWTSFTTWWNGNRTDNVLETGEYFEFTCEKPNTTIDYTNTAKVDAVWVTTSTAVTDNDTTEVKLNNWPIIVIDKRDANPANDLDAIVWNDTQTLNAWATAIFKIRVTNNGKEALKNIILNDPIESSCWWNVTLPSTYPSTWSGFVDSGSGSLTDNVLEPGEYFEYNCQKLDTQGDYTNTASVQWVWVTSWVTVTDSDPTEVRLHGGGSSSSSSGWSGPSCIQIQMSDKSSTGTTLQSDVTCYGNSRAIKFGIDCNLDGTLDVIWDWVDVPNSGYQRKFTGICNYSSDSKMTKRAKCYVGKYSETPTVSSAACTTQVTVGWDTTCWDGVLQRPNSFGQMEECERMINLDGSISAFPSFCNSQCKIDFNTTPGNCPNTNGGCVITIPNEWEVFIQPADSIIIGNAINPFSALNTVPYIKNNSSYDLHLDKLCVTRKSGNTLSGVKECVNIGDFYPGQVVKFPAFPNYISSIANIPVGTSYGDNQVITTIENGGQLYDWAYFAAKLNVRVAKPSVATTWGGTSVLKNTQSLSNVKEVAQGKVSNPNDNNNFVGTSVSDLSSYAKDTLDTATRTKVETSVDLSKTTSAVTATHTTASLITSLWTLDDVSGTYKYNGMDNVYIVKGQNLSISSIPTYLIGPRTYIVEDADLVINGDLKYADNIAFVVKWGNIIVRDTVKELDGVYIAIPKWNIGGQITQTTETSNVLTVNGSLYWQMENLFKKRTYVRDNSDGQIDVGTIVSFASSLFRKPAPLVSEFIDEYTKAAKVAK